MDHYKVLGITNDASKAEIKDAFRKLAIKFHPDKHSQSSDSIKQNALLRFKQVSEAYEVLIDDRKRAQYNISRSGGAGFAGGTRGSGAGFAGGTRGSGAGYGKYYDYSNAGKGSYYGYGPGNGSYGYGKWSYYGPRYSETPRSGPGLHYSVRFVNIPSMGSFIRNLAVASVLCAGVVAIEACGETLWKVQNSGKSFEETIDSIEKIKAEKGKR